MCLILFSFSTVENASLFQGDLVLQCDHLFELVTKLCVIAKKQSAVSVVQGR